MWPPIEHRWDIIWYRALEITGSYQNAHALSHDSIWLYEPSIKDDPLYVIGLTHCKTVNLWLAENELTHCIRNGIDSLIFDHLPQHLLFQLMFSEYIQLWD